MSKRCKFILLYLFANCVLGGAFYLAIAVFKIDYRLAVIVATLTAIIMAVVFSFLEGEHFDRRNDLSNIHLTNNDKDNLW